MKKILKIAQVELSILFYSPIAWLVLIIFVVQSGVTFIDLLNAAETRQQMGTTLESVTSMIFGGNQGFFNAVSKKLYLYIPLLTMGLMSRELSSGSIKLLLSSPLTNGQIILGKFVSMMAYGALLMGVLFALLGIAMFSIEALDVTFVLGGMLGLYLLICAYAAIGIFMSSLTSYQVVAAISTLAVFAALNFIGQIGQSIDMVREVTYWVSIAGRTDNFVNGLIGSSDVVYFLLVITFFLMLCVMKLNAGREIISQTTKILRYGLLTVIVIGVGYITSLPALTYYFDTTRPKTNTLTQNSRDIINQLDKPVVITTYVNLLNQFVHLGSPKFRKFESKQFEKYSRYIPGLEFKYVAYYDTAQVRRSDPTKTLAEQGQRAATAYGFDFTEVLSPTELKKQIDLTPEENLFVRTVDYDGKKVFLRMFFDMVGYPQEAEISAALKRLLVKPPVVGLLSGNEERSSKKIGDKDYKDVLNTLSSRSSLINQGFDIKPLQLAELDSIPADLTVLVVADPATPYSATDLEKIAAYLNGGGNMLLMGEPGKQAHLNKIIERFGLRFSEGTLLQQSREFSLDLLQTTLTAESAALGFKIPKKGVISLSGAVGIQTEPKAGMKYTPLLTTDQKYVWNKTGDFNLETQKVTFHAASEKKIAVPVAMAVTREIAGKTQKIMAIGDADIISNAELKRSNVTTFNWTFATKTFNWFSNGEFPIDTERAKSLDNHVLVSRQQISGFKIFFLGILPGAIVLAGALTLIRRKRR